ncbi:MAG: chitobiase/beta-hexosaminidase C-terminal domain-containing protein, partial [Opitutaceae bacterium]
MIFQLTVPPAVATLGFSPAPGPYWSAQSVAITSPLSGASIAYTTDGSTPTESGGTVTHGTSMSNGGSVAVGSTMTLNAIAFVAGSASGPVISGVYTINLPPVTAPVFSPAPGAYTSAETVTITSAVGGASIAYTTDGSTPTESGGTVTHGILLSNGATVSLSTTTTLNAIGFASGYTDSSLTSGNYTFPPVAASRSALVAENEPMAITLAATQANNDPLVFTVTGQPAQGTLSGTAPNLTYTPAVNYVGTDSFTFTVNDNGLVSNTATVSITVEPQAAAPVFSSLAGAYTSVQTVTITSATGGATICYTTDGSTPTETNGTIYTGPVSIGVPTTLQAIAYEVGFVDSPVTGDAYTINLPSTSAPVFSPPAGTYTSVQSVTITSATPGAIIHYTTDGTTPTETRGTLYSAPVSVNVATTLQAMAYKASYLDSSMTSGSYTLNLPPAAAPVFSPVAGTFSSAQTVTITSGTTGATIRYTIDGSAPTETNGTLYSGPVTINSTAVLHAIAYKVGFADSPITGGLYTIISSSSATLNVLYNFNTVNDAGWIKSYSALVQGSDGNFYGTTVGLGTANAGSVYKITSAGVLTTLVSFTGANGANPDGALVLGTDGNFYGTTEVGGTNSDGTVFKISPAGTLTTLASFNGTNGANPAAALVEGSDGNFYGTTSTNETVFQTTPTGLLTTLFTATNEVNPSSLVQGTDGNFYGTTVSGGSGAGTVFKLTPAGVMTTLVSFNGTNGQSPQAALVLGRDGNFYGTTESGGGDNAGTVFRMTPAGVMTTLVSFNGTNGATPWAALVQGSDGNFYGTTASGGSSNDGVIFQFVLPPTVAAPVFSPAAGTYSSAQTVTVTSATNGASVAYTTDGSTPAESGGTVTHGSLLSNGGSVAVGGTSTLVALAFKTGLADSAVVTSVYSLNLPGVVSAPTFNPAPGTYPTTQTVTITSVTSGASIAYTTDGSMPTVSGGIVTHGTLYSSAVSVGNNETIKAIAFENGLANSTVAAGAYAIQAAVPTFGTYSGNVVVTTIFSSTSGASIAYTTDGSTPT